MRGFIPFAGVPFTALSQILPFILVGIGVDDMVGARNELPVVDDMVMHTSVGRGASCGVLASSLRITQD